MKKILAVMTILLSLIGNSFALTETTFGPHPAMFTISAGTSASTDSIRVMPQSKATFLKLKMVIANSWDSVAMKVRNDVVGHVVNSLTHEQVFFFSPPASRKWIPVTGNYEVDSRLLRKLDIFEFVQVELRSDMSAAPQKAFWTLGMLSTSGTVFSLYGSDSLKFEGFEPEDEGFYHIVVHSPRIISQASALPQHFKLLKSNTYDFTTGIDKFYKATGVMVAPNVCAFPGADIAGALLNGGGGDNVCDLHEYIKILNFFYHIGYWQADLNYDGVVDKKDFLYYERWMWMESPVPYIGEHLIPFAYINYDFVFPTYNLKITNWSNISNNSLSFGIVINRTSAEIFEYAAGQYVIAVDSNIHFSNVHIESTLLDVVNLRIQGQQIWVSLIPRFGGNFEVIEQPQEIARVAMTVEGSMENVPYPVTWHNNQALPPATTIWAWVGGTAEPITTPATHTVDLLTGISQGSTNLEIPKVYSLSQNFPNPFNPSTTITYALPVNSNVSLSVYDINGREIMNLLNAQKPAGNHSIVFDGSTLSSGIYFYKIETSRYIETKKMMLIK